MSRYFTPELAALEPYTPGEQPQNRQYIKLGTVLHGKNEIIWNWYYPQLRGRTEAIRSISTGRE